VIGTSVAVFPRRSLLRKITHRRRCEINYDLLAEPSGRGQERGLIHLVSFGRSCGIQSFRLSVRETAAVGRPTFMRFRTSQDTYQNWSLCESNRSQAFSEIYNEKPAIGKVSKRRLSHQIRQCGMGKHLTATLLPACSQNRISDALKFANSLFTSHW
jgi:hypothetical protein